MKSLNVDYDYVYIIDCLTEEEYTKWKISQVLMKFLAANGVLQFTSICRNSKLLFSTLDYLVKHSNEGAKFTIHFVAHGNDKGLWVKTANEFASWDRFSTYLKEINKNMDSSLTVNMSSCFGLHGIKIVDPNSDELPYFGLIGYSDKLKVKRATEINLTYYKNLIAGHPINISVEKTKEELKDTNLFCISAEGYKVIKNTL